MKGKQKIALAIFVLVLATLGYLAYNAYQSPLCTTSGSLITTRESILLTAACSAMNALLIDQNITLTTTINPNSWKFLYYRSDERINNIFKSIYESTPYYLKDLANIPSNVTLSVDTEGTLEYANNCKKSSRIPCFVNVNTSCSKIGDIAKCYVSIKPAINTLYLSSPKTPMGEYIAPSNFVEKSLSEIDDRINEMRSFKHDFTTCLIDYYFNREEMERENNEFKKVLTSAVIYYITTIETSNWLPFLVVQKRYNLYFPDGSQAPEEFINHVKDLLQTKGKSKLYSTFGEFVNKTDLTNLDNGTSVDRLAKAHTIFEILSCDDVLTPYKYSIINQIIWLNVTNSTSSIDSLDLNILCHDKTLNFYELENSVRQSIPKNVIFKKPPHGVMDSQGNMHLPRIVQVSRNCTNQTCNYTVSFQWVLLSSNGCYFNIQEAMN